MNFNTHMGGKLGLIATAWREYKEAERRKNLSKMLVLSERIKEMQESVGLKPSKFPELDSLVAKMSIRA